MSCPKCRRLFNAKELVRILEDSGVSKKTLNTFKEEISKKKTAVEF